jgi:hypothetical protein
MLAELLLAASASAAERWIIVVTRDKPGLRGVEILTPGTNPGRSAQKWQDKELRTLYLREVENDGDDCLLPALEAWSMAVASVFEPLDFGPCDDDGWKRADLHCHVFATMLEGDGYRHVCAYKTAEYSAHVCSVRNPKKFPKGILP